MADPIQSFLSLHEQQNENTDIPQRRRPECCCGNESCAYLKHNQVALDELERDVSTAARLGKALLMRHETYITDSEQERKTMAAHVGSLEADKMELEKKNASVIEENRNLLDQLEALNNSVAHSDAHVTSLQATLASTQREMQKLSQLAARTESLERQLADFEREQAMWHSTMETKEQSERSAVRRWQTAERTLSSLQEQMERIEQEAKEEKERHAEIVERMDRRHAVEKELGSAAGRLKSAAALKTGDRDGPGTSVVSHFVKDILQDNANLQMGIVELREMLNTSNEEVENLRDQLSLHQPADDPEDSTPVPVNRKDLNAEMTRANSQELHVHHHYHAPPPAPPPAPKSQNIRKPKKKRYGAFSSGNFTPPSGASTPRSSFSYGTPTSAAAILQQTAASVPQPVSTGKRWSTQSNQTYHSILASSGPSSPQSTVNRTSSVYDRVFSDAGHDSSRPTTPDTEDPGSPPLAPTVPTHTKRGSGSWGRTYSAPIVQRQGVLSSVTRPSLDSIMSIEELPKLEQQTPDEVPIPEEDEVADEEIGWENESSPVPEPDSSITSPMSDESPDLIQQETLFRPRLRRTGSHDSLLSISGMDIHTLRDRPSQLLAPHATRAITSKAVISDTNVHAARPVAMSRNSANSRSLLSGMAADQRQASKPTLGKKVGGWVFGRWGATPAPAETQNTPVTANAAKKPESIVSSKPESIVSSGSGKASKEEKQASPTKPKIRTPGINQSGPILGMFAEVKTPPAAPVMKTFDEEALKSVLEGT